MSNDIGSALLNSFNKTGFDGSSMAKVVAEAEVAGPRSILDRKQEKATTELSALNYLKANLDAFNSYAKDLASPSLFNQYSASESSSILMTVTGSPVDASYNMVSKQLAQAHTIVNSTGFSSKNATIAQGTLTIDIAGQQKTLVVDGSNNTLEGLQQAINNGDYGISASIINTGSAYQIMFSAKNTGADNQFSFSGLDGFESEYEDPLNPGSFLSNFSVTSEGRDAILTMNGLDIGSSTNSFDNLLEGVSIKLTQEQPGLVQNMTVSRDVEAPKTAIKEFVDVYNQLGLIFKDLGSYETLTEEQKEDPANEFKGKLAGNSVLRELQTLVRESLSNLTVVDPAADFGSLASIGITMDRYGVLSLDEARLDAILSSQPDQVSRLLSKSAYSTDTESLIKVTGGNERTKTGSYELEVTQLAERATLSSDDIVGGVINIGAGASFKLKVDESNETTITLAEGSYALADFATTLQTAINNDSVVKSVDAKLQVLVDGNKIALTSERFGVLSKVEVWDMANTGELNFAIPAGNDPLTGLPYTTAYQRGQNTDGYLYMEDGYRVSFGAYADPLDGRKIKISDTAVALHDTEPVKAADVRGLSFEVLGGSIGSRGTIEYAQGYASRLYEAINNTLSQDGGVLFQRTESLTERLAEMVESRAKLDERYEKLELKYRLQFSTLQTLMSQMQSTQDFLKMKFSNSNDG